MGFVKTENKTETLGLLCTFTVLIYFITADFCFSKVYKFEILRFWQPSLQHKMVFHMALGLGS